jgi:hypothetical protein
MIRWIYLIRYPEGVPVEEGERWYLGTHTQEAKKMAEYGLVGYKTWRHITAPLGTKSRTADELNTWVRVTELTFEDWDAYKAAVIDAPIEYTGAPYGPRPFEYTTVFLGDEPEYDLLREVPDVP